MNPIDASQIKDLVHAAAEASVEANFAQRIIPLIDLTNLDEHASAEEISALCRNSDTLLGRTASVCIYPQFIEQAKTILLASSTKIATVANFPEGSTDLGATLATINTVIANGAQEIDVVMPYRAYLAGDKDIIVSFTQACKAACGANVLLKVILETGALQNLEIIHAASLAVIDAGADFIKTSTGKISIGATLEATAAMLYAIKSANKNAGIKIAGGVRSVAQAASYLYLIEAILGTAWLSPDKTRIGASSLLQELFAPVQAAA